MRKFSQDETIIASSIDLIYCCYIDSNVKKASKYPKREFNHNLKNHHKEIHVKEIQNDKLDQCRLLQSNYKIEQNTDSSHLIIFLLGFIIMYIKIIILQNYNTL